jgi:hypothetical protein
VRLLLLRCITRRAKGSCQVAAGDWNVMWRLSCSRLLWCAAADWSLVCALSLCIRMLWNTSRMCWWRLWDGVCSVRLRWSEAAAVGSEIAGGCASAACGGMAVLLLGAAVVFDAWPNLRVVARCSRSWALLYCWAAAACLLVSAPSLRLLRQRKAPLCALCVGQALGAARRLLGRFRLL